MEIRPVSDLRNHFSEIEELVAKGSPVLLTKNGHASMVVMSIDQFREINGNPERMLDEADAQAVVLDTRYTHKQVFDSLHMLVSHDKA